MDSFELARMLKSALVEETELATNFALLLLNHDDTVTTSDLVGFDLESRDVLSKTEMKKVWQALNTIGSKEVIEAIGSAGPSPPTPVDPEKLKKQILSELNSEFREALKRDVSEIVKQNSIKEIEEEEKAARVDASHLAELEEKVTEHVEETKKATSDLKVQVLKVATALKVANMSLKAQGEQLSEIKTDPRASPRRQQESPRGKSERG